ncbi:MAG: CBS domain-containing protein [Bacteroidetes bacterium]|jgi:CBS domain-containing protein|nr:CBS domain-containing protein [Bacteroidota bacterium]
MTIENVLKRKGTVVYTVQLHQPLAVAIERLHEKRIGALVVRGENDEIAGILSERDVVAALAKRGQAALTEPLEVCATEEVYTCAPSDDINTAMNWMTRERVRHLPVVEGTKLLGIVSIGDLVKQRMQAIKDEANVLRDMVIAQR